MEKLKSLKSKKKENKEAMNDAAAAAYDAVSDGVSDVKDAVGKFVQFDANKTNFFIKLRKNLDVKFPGISKEHSIIIIIGLRAQNRFRLLLLLLLLLLSFFFF